MGTLPGGSFSQANSPNNSGNLVTGLSTVADGTQHAVFGIAETATRDPECPPEPAFTGTGPQVLDYRAVIWGPGAGEVRDLHPLPGDTVSMALWINDGGQAVGASGRCSNSVLPPLAFAPHAVIWDKDGSVHDLGNLGSTAINVALSINNQGQVVGASSLNDHATPFDGTHGYLWNRQTGMRDLGTLPGDLASAGTAINDKGDVVGLSVDPEGTPRAAVWQDGAIHELNELVVGDAHLLLLFASGINARGEIAGFGATETGDVHGVLAIPSNGVKGNSVRPRRVPASRFLTLPTARH